MTDQEADLRSGLLKRGLRLLEMFPDTTTFIVVRKERDVLVFPPDLPRTARSGVSLDEIEVWLEKPKTPNEISRVVRSPEMAKFKKPYDLHCSINELHYDFDARIGKLYMPPDNCCDMGACIELFKKIDPKVRLIDAFAGDELDITYARYGDSWDAKDRRVLES